MPNGPSFPARQGGFPYHEGTQLLTLPVPPWPPARYLPRTGTLRCRCILPHGFQHNAVQNLSSVFPPVSRFLQLFRTFLFHGCIIAHNRYHKSDLQRILQTKSRPAPDAEPDGWPPIYIVQCTAAYSGMRCSWACCSVRAFS